MISDMLAYERWNCKNICIHDDKSFNIDLKYKSIETIDKEQK